MIRISDVGRDHLTWSAYVDSRCDVDRFPEFTNTAAATPVVHLPRDLPFHFFLSGSSLPVLTSAIQVSRSIWRDCARPDSWQSVEMASSVCTVPIGNN